MLLKLVTGNRERGTGNGEQGTGNMEQITGNGEQETENRERGTGNEERGTGSGERESGNDCTAVTWLRIQDGWQRTKKGTRGIKDVRAHCYCASLVRTLFIGHARATSFLSARTDSKTQQNIERMTFALTWCANIFVGCSVTPTFFREITSFSDSFHHTEKQKKSVCGNF